MNIRKFTGNGTMAIGALIILGYSLQKVGVIAKGIAIIFSGIIGIIPALLIGVILLVVGSLIKGNNKSKQIWEEIKRAGKAIKEALTSKDDEIEG